ncbi:2-amino-4-hydroxy-6-hydroxymethyldihydropteridine diphosphokinase [Psychromicrobium lacuslunae]|uniref:2-amino-4-hydroxy-6-hydroxymethyldihydropteridine diphosphokinase n=1 Tax=Psychromicrobium lacuslunae TaxID=1618207 RepID=A0A0D4C0Y8_9MICC|nr:2-amino-4-hydroxy-6-hydroxymethyldihydropteridine diphosphokinase [Psychromicrobium lacuslunae]AJT42357.1 2-amino-4-hydroxy-6-hydroxymethyldihydropteridine pyrophosphokinase [Psychromicrobium lacuslunae]
MTVRAVLALGSNLGERSDTLAEAVADIVDHPLVRLCDVSPVVQTEPVGGPEDQPLYLNMVMEIETDLEPLELLRHCQAVEAKHHRERVVRWGPRTLDIDIIVYDQLEQDDPELTLPHPRAAERAFVLVPWLLMDPAATLLGVPVRQLAAAAEDLGGVEDFDASMEQS